MLHRRSRLAWSWFFLATPVLLACNPDRAPESSGELRNGTFAYHCVSEGDRVCRDGDTFPAQSEELPRGDYMGVGAPFALSFEAYDPSVQPVLELVDPSRGTVHQDGDIWHIEMTSRGFATFVMRTDDTAVDVLTLGFHVPKYLAIDGSSPDGHVFSIKGAQDAVATLSEFTTLPTTLTVSSYILEWDDEKHLIGGFDCAWTSSDESVVAFTSSPNKPTVEIEVNSGTATVGVTYAGLSSELEMTFP